MINKDDRAGWLGEESADVKALLRAPDNNSLKIWPVNRAVGNVRNNAAELLVAG